MKFTALLLVFCFFTLSTQFTLAQTASIPTFQVKTLVSDGKKSKEKDSKLTFSETSFRVAEKKNAVIIKEFNYADVKVADYSYAKKPLVSTTGAVVGTILLGPLFLVTLFIKKKQHWLSIRTENDYVVMKLEKENFRQITNEFEIRKVKITTVNEDENSDKKDKEKKDN